MMKVMDDDRALYVPDGDGFVATLRTQGGWHPEQQHGGPVQALMARAVEHAPSLIPMQVARLSHDLIRPVPIGKKLTVAIDIVREGKRIQLIDTVLRVGDVEHARTRALRLRDDDMSGVSGMGAEPPDTDAELPWAENLPTADFEGATNLPGFMEGIELRRFPRPNAPEGLHGYWIGLRGPLIAGEATTPLQLLSVAADFANMIGRSVDAKRVTSINPDLNVHVLRLPEDPWIAVVGETRLALPTGIGVSTANLRDRSGICGLASNCQLIQHR
jgi:hypothetical protein